MELITKERLEIITVNAGEKQKLQSLEINNQGPTKKNKYGDNITVPEVEQKTKRNNIQSPRGFYMAG